MKHDKPENRNNTGGSIFAAMLFHTMNNLSFFMFPTLETTLGGLYLLILNVVVVVAVLTIWRNKTLILGTHPHNHQQYFQQEM